MPIEVSCPSCSHRLRAPDTAAGKRVKCPKCKSVIQVPAAESAPAAEMWHVKTADGAEYGPVPKSELDQWCEEGRLTEDCQVLRDGGDQWQWASDLYPQLDQAAAPTAPAVPTTPAAPQVSDSPFQIQTDPPAAAAAPSPTPTVAPTQTPSFTPKPTPGVGVGASSARHYPALLAVSKWLNPCAWAVLIAGAVGALWLFVEGMMNAFKILDVSASLGLKTMGITVLTTVGIALSVAATALVLFFLSAVIPVLLHIQDNTYHSSQQGREE